MRCRSYGAAAASTASICAGGGPSRVVRVATMVRPTSAHRHQGAGKVFDTAVSGGVTDDVGVGDQKSTRRIASQRRHVQRLLEIHVRSTGKGMLIGASTPADHPERARPHAAMSEAASPRTPLTSFS